MNKDNQLQKKAIKSVSGKKPTTTKSSIVNVNKERPAEVLQNNAELIQSQYDLTFDKSVGCWLLAAKFVILPMSNLTRL